MSQITTIHRRVHFHTTGRRRVLREGPPTPEEPHPPGRVPRVSRLMALAIHIEHLVRTGQVQDYAAVASLSHVTRPRVTQVVNLTLLAPDIQEAILFLPRVQYGRDPIIEHDLRPIAAEPDWQRQRAMWERLKGQIRPGSSD